MKTKNVFDLTKDSVTMTVFDNTDSDNPKELGSFVFDVNAIPAELEDGDNPVKSLAAYGLSRLMQDRCSDYTDGKLAEFARSVQEMADARIEAYKAVYDVLAEGQFRARKAASAKAGSAVDTFFASGFSKFLCEAGKPVTIEQATAILQGLGNDERKALRADARIKGYIDEARREAREAVKDIDIAALLG